jgi:surface polysaccharide O-acyltransferase-like enzyme
MVRRGGLDSVKGIAIGMIVASHVMPIALDNSRTAQTATNVLGFFGMYIMPIAVAAFYLVSLSLYYEKPRFARRMSRLAQLFGFWVGLQYLLDALLLHKVPPLDLTTLSKGGPSLTGISTYPSVFWFLFDLMALTLFAEVFRRAMAHVGRRSTIYSWAIIAGFCAVFLADEIFGIHIDHWSLFNFIIYVPLAWLIREADWPVRRIALAYVALTAAELAFVWAMPGARILSVSGYARLAIPTGAAALFLWGREARPHPTLEWLGRHSLGIYALHDTLRILFLRWLPPIRFGVGGVKVTLTIFAALCAVALSIALTWILSQTPLRRFVT